MNIRWSCLIKLLFSNIKGVWHPPRAPRIASDYSCILFLPEYWNMGSKCSILNDTEHDVWITHGVNWTVLIASVGAVVGVLTAGIGIAALGATVGAGGALAGGGALIMAEEGIIMGVTATTVVGLTAAQWSLAGVVTALSSTALAQALNISREEAEKLQRSVKDFQVGFFFRWRHWAPSWLIRKS